MSFAAITHRLVEFRNERDWQQHHTPANLAVSIAVEAGELLECFQWNAEPSVERVADELADVVIYAFNLAEALGIDLESATWHKIEENARRFPMVAR
jgi:dCTP diphosphatase